MTREFYEKLLPYEQKFRWAIKSNFISMSQGDFAQIAELYQELYGKGLTKSQTTCNTCRLNALKKLGNDFFAKQEEIAQREAKKTAKAAAEENNKSEETKKVGRPPKIDLNAE